MSFTEEQPVQRRFDDARTEHCHYPELIIDSLYERVTLDPEQNNYVRVELKKHLSDILPIKRIAAFGLSASPLFFGKSGTMLRVVN